MVVLIEPLACTCGAHTSKGSVGGPARAATWGPAVQLSSKIAGRAVRRKQGMRPHQVVRQPCVCGVMPVVSDVPAASQGGSDDEDEDGSEEEKPRAKKARPTKPAKKV